MLASPEYIKQQEKLHATGQYGVTAKKYGALISQIVDRLEIDHLLDYGCGSNLSLQETFRPQRAVQYQCYDPGVPEYSEPPIPAQMVVSIDVLEHIEPECLEAVFAHLSELTEEVLFASVHTGPAGKTLEDGRNAHLTQQPPEWWLPRFWEYFALQSFQVVSPVEFFVICHNPDLEVKTANFGPSRGIAPGSLEGAGKPA